MTIRRVPVSSWLLFVTTFHFLQLKRLLASSGITRAKLRKVEREEEEKRQELEFDALDQTDDSAVIAWLRKELQRKPCGLNGMAIGHWASERTEARPDAWIRELRNKGE